jgi:hypothetical protein
MTHDQLQEDLACHRIQGNGITRAIELLQGLQGVIGQPAQGWV